MGNLFNELDDLAATIDSILELEDTTYVGYLQIEEAVNALFETVKLIEAATGVDLRAVQSFALKGRQALRYNRAEAIYFLNEGFELLLDVTDDMEQYPEVRNVYH